ncbi:MAG: hypothetical protein R6V62_01320 [Candidatus Fermentibacteraceae bacterium]
MKPFNSLTGQSGAKSLLYSAVASDRLAHAYLIAGPEGCGRLSMALDLAACVICPEDPRGFCGECRHCKRLFSMNHPDVRLTIPRTAAVTVDEEAALLAARVSDGVTPVRFPGNTGISIGQIREIEARLSRKSFEGRGHVEIILDAHLMRREAANALLKTLEEPPEKTLLILTTSFLSGVLPTVRSRAHCVRLGTLGFGDVKSILAKRTGLSPEDIETLALASGGSPGRALAAASSWAGRDEGRALGLLRTLAGTQDQGELLEYAGGLARELGRDGLLALCDEMAAVCHDSRRGLAERAPVNSRAVVQGVFTDDYLERAGEQFILCGTRLRANGSPTMAFEAAVLSLGGQGRK